MPSRVLLEGTLCTTLSHALGSRSRPHCPRRLIGGAHRAQRARQLSSLTSVQVSPERISLCWSDGLWRQFHPLWLADNDGARRHASSRQKLQSAAELPSTLQVAAAEVCGETLRVRWQASLPESSFCARWLRHHGSDEDQVEVTRLAHSTALDTGPSGPRQPAFELHSVSYEELRGGDQAVRWRWLSALAERGATLVEDVPASVDGVDGVQWVATLVGPMQPNIYGEIFDVIAGGEHAGINLAYTNAAIGPHQDLCYYESPPGLQLLHCREFDAAVVGGDSLLIDAFAAAERVRDEAPWAFDVLSRVPATFIKDHSRRAQPVLLSYQRPHLAIDPRSRRLTSVFWSPPFEGPLVGLALADVDAYYAAYRVLHAAIDAAPHWQRRMAPGQMLVFNNRRMLHGRTGFELHGGVRHLRGGYVNIDEFANTFNLLRRAVGCDHHGTTPPLGNQDWASMAISLPQDDGV